MKRTYCFTLSALLATACSSTESRTPLAADEAVQRANTDFAAAPEKRSTTRLTYSASCGTPRPGWMRPGDSPGGYPLWDHVVLNFVALADDGTLFWNGRAVTKPTLHSYFRLIAEQLDQPAVILRAQSGADCEAVQTIRDEMQEILSCEATRRCGEGDGEWQP